MNPLRRIIQDKYLLTFLMAGVKPLLLTQSTNRLATVSKIALFDILAIELSRCSWTFY